MKQDSYYDSIAGSYDELYKKEQLKKLRIILKNIRLSPSDRILDVGCGTCFSLEYFDNGVGIDPSIELLKKSKKPVVCAFAEKIPFRDSSFDYVLSITSMHHFDFQKAIPEMLRVGKKNFVFSLLKKAANHDELMKCIQEHFKITKTIDEEKDAILFCERL